MDPFVGWFQEEQEGPALRTWFAIWETNSAEMQQQLELQQNNKNYNNNNGSNSINNSNGNNHHHNSNNNNNNNNNSKDSAAAFLLQQFGGGVGGGGGGVCSVGDTTPTIEREREKFITHERSYYNPSRRKPGSTVDNKASTYNMNKYQDKLIGKHKGCPWRPPGFQYGRGVLG